LGGRLKFPGYKPEEFVPHIDSSYRGWMAGSEYYEKIAEGLYMENPI